MKNIISSQEMRSLEQKALQRGISEEELMDRAGAAITAFMSSYLREHRLRGTILIITGKGNNGGDGYTAAKNFYERNLAVAIYEAMPPLEGSLAAKKRQLYIDAGGTILPEFDCTGVALIIDAIFGIGFTGTIPEPIATLINRINNSHIPIIAIDIPSGLNADTGEAINAICATYTLTIELPKIGFFIGQGWNYVGTIECLSIGIEPEIGSLHTQLQFIEELDVRPLLPKIIRNRHKYQSGHVVGIAGSHGMSGAAMMASLAALKTGAGIVHLAHNESISNELSGPPWEVIRFAYQEDNITPLQQLLQRAKACFVGPGIGSTDANKKVLELLWNDYKTKVVIDADALNWLSTTKKFLQEPLPGAIFTPHLGEAKRLFGLETTPPIGHTLFLACQRFVDEHTTHLILKGAPSFLFSHGAPILVMPRGNPGMATAGSGDVLTGILVSLLAQGLSQRGAMCLGTYLHGLAGEYAADEATAYCMTATSIIDHLPDAFKQLQIGHSCM